MSTNTQLEPAKLQAELQALHELAARHRREFIRLRTVHYARLTGTRPHFTRHRMTQAELDALPAVTSADGTVLERGLRVRCPDGLRAVILRVDRRSRRCVVRRSDGTEKMVTANRLMVLDKRQLAAVS